MPTAMSLEFSFGVLKCGIRVVLKPSGVESANQQIETEPATVTFVGKSRHGVDPPAGHCQNNQTVTV